MGHCHHQRNKERKKAACVVCILGLILLIVLLLILYFFVFKPKDPRVQVPVMQMALYNAAAAGMPPNMTSLNLGLNLQVYIYNPNRGDFYIEGESTASIYYGATQMGEASFPNHTHISSQSFITISVYVGMQRPIMLNMPTIPNTNMILPISTVVSIFGHVTTAGVFSHWSSVVSVCNLSIALASSKGHIQSYNCERSYPITK